MITTRQMISALKQLRSRTEFWSFSASEQEARSSAFMKRLGVEVTPHHYTLSERLEFYSYRFRQSVVRPAMVGVGLLVLVVGGWMTSVSAAYEAVPGDLLYPIKIASEQAQLTIATSDQARAQLHMEFASRRLAEVSSISNSNASDKTGRMKTAVDGFKNEVAETKTVMQNMQGSTDAVAVASALDTKASEYTAVIDQATQTLGNSANVTNDVTQEVAGARQDAEQASNDAVQVMVTSVEEGSNENVAGDLKKSLQSKLVGIDQQVKLTLGRIAVIQHVADLGQVKMPNGTDLHFMSSQLQHLNTQTNEAVNMIAAGGYRSALEVLAVVQSTIDKVEAQVVDLELIIVEQKNAASASSASSIVTTPVESSNGTTDTDAGN